MNLANIIWKAEIEPEKEPLGAVVKVHCFGKGSVKYYTDLPIDPGALVGMTTDDLNRIVNLLEGAKLNKRLLKERGII